MVSSSQIQAAGRVTLLIAKLLAIAAVYLPLLVIVASFRYRRMVSAFSKAAKKGGLPNDLAEELKRELERRSAPLNFVRSVLPSLRDLGDRYYEWLS